MQKVVVLECPQCGAPVQVNSNICNSCFSEYMISSMNDLDALDKMSINKYIKAYKEVSDDHGSAQFSMGICYLKLGLYDFALKAFEKVIDMLPEDGEVYYYAALALFKGKRPFLAQLSIVKKAIAYLEAALQMEETGKYYYLLYVIQKDFYDMKKLRNQYQSTALLEQAKMHHVSQEEVSSIKTYTCVD